MGVNSESKIVMKKINEIRPYVRNPRRNEKTVELLCQLIPKVGFNVPLVIDQKGVIVKGHARYAAAIRLGMTELPCIVSHASEEAIKIDRITDNKIAEYSEWMNEEVGEEIDSINTDIDFSALGFPRVEFSSMPSEAVYGSLSDENDEEDGEGVYSSTLHQEPYIAPQRYYKFVCKNCGRIMFIPEESVDEWSS